MSPSRRELLRTCGPALWLATAGCLSAPSGGRTSETAGTNDETTAVGSNESTAEPRDSTAKTTGSTTERPPDPETTAGPPSEVREVDPAAVASRGVPRSPSIESDTYEPFRGFVVGERPETPGDHYETPHVWVWNLTGEPTTVELALASGDADLLEVEAEFPAGEPLAVVFRDRGTYELTVRVGDLTEIVEVGPDRFWCNATGTDVLVKRDGIDTETISTSMACTTTPGGS